MVQNTLPVDTSASLAVPLLQPAGDNAADRFAAVTQEEGCLEPQIMYTLPSAHTGTHWLLTTALMMSDMFGLGALSLPADFARLGWLPALTCMAWFTTTNIYAGIVYQRLILKVPQAVIFDEIGAAALGQCGQVLVYGTVYLTILCQPVMFQLMCMEALQQVLYMYNLRWEAACLVIAGLMLPLAQISNIEEVAWVSIMGSIGMLVAMVIICGKLTILFLGRRSPAPTQPVSHQGFEVGVIGLMDIAFAFGGQQNWMRWLSSMKHRNRFAAAVTITTGLMSAVYLVTAVTGYAALGTDVDMQRPISSVIGQDSWTLAMNAGILIHCIIAYQVIINVWASTLLHMMVGRGSQTSPRSITGYNNSVWLLVTVVCISLSACLAYSLPFFSIIMAVVASLGDIMSMFGLPCLFAIKLLRLPRWEVGLCALMVVAASVASGVGVVSSLRQLVQAYQQDKGQA